MTFITHSHCTQAPSPYNSLAIWHVDILTGEAWANQCGYITDFLFGAGNTVSVMERKRTFFYKEEVTNYNHVVLIIFILIEVVLRLSYLYD